MSSEFNPYRAPMAAVETQGGMGGTAADASKGQRFGTLVVDYLGYFVLSFIAGIALGMVMVATGVRPHPGSSFGNFVFGLAVLTGYYLFFEGIWGRTPGKFVFGTVVVDMNGAKPAIGTILVRTLCRFIPFEAFSFFGARGWHDSISKTRVVRTRGG